MEIKRFSAEYRPQDNAGTEVATMVLASDHDRVVALLRASRDEWCEEYTKARYERDALRREVEMLRLYGNKDCTAMADAALNEAP